jgi:hypothetical protein
MTKFEDRLFDELMHDHGAELSAPRAAHRTRRVARPMWLSGGVLAAAGATAAGLVMFGSGAAPAFAVTQNRDGTATIALSDVSGVAGANQKLHSLGDNVVIVPVEPGCEPVSSLPRVPGLQGRTMGGSSGTVGGQITVNVTGIPAGDIAVVAYQQSGRSVQMSVTITSPPAPSCVSMPAPPPPQPGATQSGGLSSAPPATTTG